MVTVVNEPWFWIAFAGVAALLVYALHRNGLWADLRRVNRQRIGQERARLVGLCAAEIHFDEDGTGRSCSREVDHEGAHYSMRQVPHGYSPIAWFGDDRGRNTPV